MPDDGKPDLRYADRWVRDSAQQLAELAHEHNDSRLMDIRATLLDVATRGRVVDRYRTELPTPAQANALARRFREGHEVKYVSARPFDLPPDYLLVVFEDGFTCGISAEGEVSS